jgi:RNA polymerase sigma-70 factor (family 1)
MEIDRETILLMSKGDKKAYETMFRRFYPKVHRFVAMLLKNKDDADDVCQLIFLKIWNKREKFTDVRDFDSYLFILTKYTVINYISSRHVMPIDIDSLPDRYSNESSPFDDVVAKDTQLLIDMMVENMPQQRQMIYRMSREQHLKNEEIALQLGIQKKTVENHLNLALKEIKKALYFVFLLTQLWG